METGEVVETRVTQFTLMPAPPGTCPECARAHLPDQPHDATKFRYKYDFYGKHGRWPTWKDAIAHCAPEVRAAWEEGLKEKGAWTE